MKKRIFKLLITFLIFNNLYAQEVDSNQIMIDAIEESLTYETGVVELESCNVKLNIPSGFRYLDRLQSIYVLTELWGNPVDSTILGMIFPSNRGVLADDTWAFVIRFDEIGYVNDDDAEAIDYHDLLQQMQKETDEANPERIRQGYERVKLIGWASFPFYDKDLKTLHWAKEIQFGDETSHSLNYNLRVLGRKGVLVLNAVATMNDLPEVTPHIERIINCVEFDKRYQYADFTPGVDQVAAWTLGSLVTGKMLAKVGFFGLLLKFWKIIVLGLAGLGGAIWKILRGGNENEG